MSRLDDLVVEVWNDLLFLRLSKIFEHNSLKPAQHYKMLVISFRSLSIYFCSVLFIHCLLFVCYFVLFPCVRSVLIVFAPAVATRSFLISENIWHLKIFPRLFSFPLHITHFISFVSRSQVLENSTIYGHEHKSLQKLRWKSVGWFGRWSLKWSPFSKTFKNFWT